MKNFSLAGLLCSYLIIFYFAFIYYPKWTQPAAEATISYDVSGYYLYLPAIFIYHDIHYLEFQKELNNKYRYSPGDYQGVQLPDGNYTMKYSTGAAIMYLPWFFAGHIFAKVYDYPADGFSLPYQAALSWDACCMHLRGYGF